jgi:hypothetical protein
MAKTFGTIRVRHEDAEDSEALVLTFTDRRVYDDTRRALMKSVGLKVIDECFCYQIFTNADDAMKSVRAFCRQPIKPRDLANI